MTDEVRAIILAAGAARRLGDEIGDLPKCLAEVDGRPVIDYQLAPLAPAAEVVLVVGYRADFLREELVRRYPERTLRFVENADFDATNTIWSLRLARDALARGAMLFNADVVVDPRVIGRLLAADEDKSWLAVTRAACADEEVKVVVDEDGRVIRVGKELDPAVCAGEFIGAARFSPACGARYAHELDAIAAGHKRSFFEFALDRILGEQDVRMLDVTDLPCIEIDFPDDLARARREVGPKINGRAS
jgi:choline kinase